ncbi:MAG: hypothetical protein LBL83_12915 [Clostridiales bacterium]|nr:hypothetical protein [Clostridiales bacterium]
MAVSYAGNSSGIVDNNAFVQQIIDKGKADASSRNTGELGKEDFLNLLVLQLRYQDPLNPMEDKEFIAQMAQFSSLEQMQNMNASVNAAKGFSMIGKYVAATLSDESTGLNQEVEGHVESVAISGSKTYVIVDGKQVPIENVYSISDGYNPLSSSLSAYTGLIGYNVKGAVYDVSTGEIVGVTGDVASLAKGTYEDYAILNGVSAVIAGVSVNGAMVSDRAKLREYLEGVDAKTDAKDRHVEVFVTDSNGANVPIGATLRSFALEPDGSYSAVLDDVAIPVTSVAVIKAGAGDSAGAGAPGDSGATNGANGADAPDGEAGAPEEAPASPEALASEDALARFVAATESMAASVAEFAKYSAAQSALAAYGS